MAEAIQTATSSPTIVQWILDTRPLWPVTKRATSRDEVEELQHVVSPLFSLTSDAD